MNLKRHLEEIAQNLISGVDFSPAVQLMKKNNGESGNKLTKDKTPLPEEEGKADPIIDPHPKQSHSGPPAFGLPPTGKLGEPKLKETLAVAGGAALPPARTYGEPLANMHTGPSAIGEKKYKIKKNKINNTVVYEILENNKSIYSVTAINEHDAAEVATYWLREFKRK